ncbi:MAG: RNA polymerase subunit sigma-70 [Phycisphaerales bacterium]|nr:RNA polymerase subunit sigma-70 [Phycisphaerales bacterium]
MAVVPLTAEKGGPDDAASREGAAGMPARELLPLIYAQLHEAARRLMAGERVSHTLQPTALVNEAYARLSKDLAAQWPGPREFYAAAAQAMRRILIEHARKRGAVKRGGDWSRAALDVIDLASDEDCGRLMALDDAILRLEEADARAASVVRMRFYAGLSVDSTAAVLGLSRRTVLRDWDYARAWLLRRLTAEIEGG